jgi:serine/threonine-protein kinase ULK2
VKLEAIERRDRTLFLVMEWCEGGDLASLMRERPEGPLNEQEASGYIAQLAEALRTLRRANLVHRDIKPQNLLLSKDYKTLKLADFGFARYVEEDNLAETLCGSPLYMV